MYKLIILLFITFLIFACSEKGTEPPEEDKLCEITDTTSHYIEWRTDTLGAFSSYLRAVDVIDPQNVWAVGDIDTIDGSDFDTFNAVKWNGTDFELYKFQIRYADGDKSYQALNAIKAFSKDDIWMFSVAGSYLHWNGNTWETDFIYERKGQVLAVWGEPDDFYLAGNNGSLTYYDGQSFTLLESNTTKDLFDINGYIDPESGQKQIWALGGGGIFGDIMIYFNGENWIKVWDRENPPIETEYTFPRKIYIPEPGTVIIACAGPEGTALICLDINDYSKSKILSLHELYSYAVAGSNLNNIFVAGEIGIVSHFNGSTSKDISFSVDTGRRLWDSGFINNEYFAVGFINSRGYFLHGKQ